MIELGRKKYLLSPHSKYSGQSESCEYISGQQKKNEIRLSSTNPIWHTPSERKDRLFLYYPPIFVPVFPVASSHTVPETKCPIMLSTVYVPHNSF
jgi:hypothetical protein